MPLDLLGPDPFVRDSQGHFAPRVATLFPIYRTLVTRQGIHLTQRNDFLDNLDAERARRGEPPLNEEERSAISAKAVDLIVQRDAFYIRPDLEKMDLSLMADEQLQQKISKRFIRFLSVQYDAVHNAVKGHGECWRIAAQPISTSEMIRTIRFSRMAIAGKSIYLHSATTGTRWLTCEEFARLASQDGGDLRAHLLEIQRHLRQFNQLGNREVDFFIAGKALHRHIGKYDFNSLRPAELREAQAELLERFRELVPSGLWIDNATNIDWRSRVIGCLQPVHEDRLLEEQYLGLAPEFHRHVQWLPGGRFVDGELFFDSVFDENQEDFPSLLRTPCDMIARELIFNCVRTYDDIEYINVGHVHEKLSLKRRDRGRRRVYVVEMKLRHNERETIKLIRLMKWGVREHLNDEKDLLDAMRKAEEYRDYYMDRRYGCRRLGMNLPAEVHVARISETYDGGNSHYRGTKIWTPYFERDYFHGTATDKIPEESFRDREFAIRFAELLGRAAAPNLIVGRYDPKRDLYFDDGDEVIAFCSNGRPNDLIATQHTGSFLDYSETFEQATDVHARPVNERIDWVDDPVEFAETYLNALIDYFQRIQWRYRERRRSFDSLFAHRLRDEEGSFAYRWECVLRRLDGTDPKELREQLWAKFKLPSAAM